MNAGVPGGGGEDVGGVGEIAVKGHGGGGQQGKEKEEKGGGGLFPQSFRLVPVGLGLCGGLSRVLTGEPGVVIRLLPGLFRLLPGLF